ncbi:MAG: alkaline phosphatase [Pseudomonadales bacterium]
MTNRLSACVVFCITLLLAPSASAKNVVFFLGDGMGISTITAARIFAGQLQGADGEEFDLAFDRFDNVALIKTYNTDAQVPDSAGTITAIMAGQKTRIGVVGVAANVARDDCVAALDNPLPSIAELAEERGLRTGIVSTARITHATPAGSYAHSPNRNWEDSASLPAEAKAAGCTDIAQQLLDTPHGDGPDVILGGGRAHFLPDSMVDPEYSKKNGKRDDGRNLIEQWLQGGSGREYVWNRQDFLALTERRAKGEGASGQVMGLFEPSHMQFEADRASDPAGEPSLLEMTQFALAEMQKSERGYFLLVEAGRIDHAHHGSNAYRALADTVELSEAVQWVVDHVDLNDTLILVTADHSHTMTISGYPRRGNPILGLVESQPGKLAKDATGLPYTTLSYANGGGYKKRRPDLTEVDTAALNYQQLGTIPMYAETHAGEDVAAFAVGVNADKVRGVMEQNALFDVMHDALFEQDE